MEYMVHKSAPPPLTYAEEELKFINENDVSIL